MWYDRQLLREQQRHDNINVMQIQLRTCLAATGLIVGASKTLKSFVDKDPLVTHLRIAFFDVQEPGPFYGTTGVMVKDQNDNEVGEFADLLTVDIAASIIRPMLPLRLSSVRGALNDYSDFLIEVQSSSD